MSPTEVWLLVAAIVAGLGVVAHLLVDPPVVHRIAPALVAAAVGLVAVALLIALP